MARLPSAEDLGQRPVPSARGGISRLQLSTPRRGAEEQAAAQMGQVIQGLGDTLGALGFREKQKLDEARSEDAFTQYQNKTLELEYGQDEGFSNVRGGDAVKRPMVEDYRARRESIAKEIRDTLQDDNQKIAFDKRAQIVDRQFDARLYRHIAEQTNVYQNQVYEGVLATERKAAALNWDQPGQIEMSILRSNMEVERKGRNEGLPRDAIDQMKTIAQTQIHADVMTQMLITGKDKAAAAYYGQVKDQLTPEAMVLLGSKIKGANIEGEAIRGADVVWNMLGPKGPNDTIRLDVMESYIRDRYKDSPQEMKAAIQDVRSRVVAFKDGQQELTASNKSAVLEKFHDGASLEEIRSMPEYMAMDGAEKVKVRDYMMDAGWTQQQRARAQDSYRQGAKASAAFSQYWELSNPTVLSSMSEKQILSLEPVMGQELVGDLMQAKRKLNSPENVKAATIDAELFNVIAADAGLKPYEKSNSTEQKEYLGRLRNEVEGAIDSEQRRTGKVLNREEKEKVMRSMVDKKVMVDEFGRDPSLPAPVIKPELRSKVYVPIDTIDNKWIRGAANYMRSQGIVPTDWDDATIKKNMKGRLERAYGVSITGGTSEEGRKALEGKDQ